MLRLIACTAMLIDHIGYQYNILECRIVGRIAFPIFVYLICNGYRHTSNRRNYALRLSLFALLSQVPFSLFCYGVLWHGHGNVFFTLLLALLSIWSAEELRKRPVLKYVAFLPALIICTAYYYQVIDSDYGARGIVMAMVFYYLDGRDLLHRFLMVLGMAVSVTLEYVLSCGKVLLLGLLGRGFVFPELFWWDRYQLYALFALVFIFCYNGQKGKYPKGNVPAKLTHYGFYLFYPAHQLVLWLIRVL